MSRQNDLTQGVIWRQLVKYAVPLVLSNLLQAMYGTVDTIIAGRFVGSASISAISNSTQIMTILTSVMIGVTTGGNILIGQYFGARDRENCRESAVTLFTMGLALGAVLAAVFFVCARLFLRLLGAPALEEATVYLRICSIGLIFITGYNACSAALRAVGNSRAPLICIVITSLMNVALDYLFVAVFHWGTAGTAWATIIAQGASFLAAMLFVLRSYDLFGLKLSRLYIRADKLKTIVRLGVPVALQLSIASISWLTVTYLINRYGTYVSAGSGVAIKIKDFCQLFITAMVNASTGMIAQCLGAGLYDRAKQVLYTAMAITVGMALSSIVLVRSFAPELVAIFTDQPETAAAAVRNLRIEILGQVFYAVLLIYHSLALVAGHTWFVLISSFANCIPVRLVVSILLERAFGIVGVYWACAIAPLASVPLGVVYTRSNKWRRTMIREE